ncbi:hypothetical protein D3C86_1438230 [compost metagenome]
MEPVAIGGLHQQVIRPGNGFRRAHDHVMLAAEVAREHNPLALHIQRHDRRADDVPRPVELRLHAGRHRHPGGESGGLEPTQRARGVGGRIER